MKGQKVFKEKACQKHLSDTVEKAQKIHLMYYLKKNNTQDHKTRWSVGKSTHMFSKHTSQKTREHSKVQKA